MIPVDQVGRGIAVFYDEEVKPSIPDWKGMMYGVVVGRVASRLPKLIAEYAQPLLALGLAGEDGLDVEGVAADIKSQMQKNGGVMIIPLMGDKMTLRGADIDALVRCIERA